MNDQKKIGHDWRTAKNGTGTGTVHERKNYCNNRILCEFAVFNV